MSLVIRLLGTEVLYIGSPSVPPVTGAPDYLSTPVGFTPPRIGKSMYGEED